MCRCENTTTTSGDLTVAARKEQRSINLPADVWDEIDNAVYATQSLPGGVVSRPHLIEKAVRAFIKKLRRQFNDGEPFPARGADPRPGRRPDLP